VSWASGLEIAQHQVLTLEAQRVAARSFGRAVVDVLVARRVGPGARSSGGLLEPEVARERVGELLRARLGLGSVFAEQLGHQQTQLTRSGGLDRITRG
jgi:hypothetical protein